MGVVKKTLATIVIGMAIFVGGVTSCHYTVSHYHYSKKNYESCFWHAYRAGQGISAYKPNAYRYAFDIALQQSKYSYDDSEEYYQYYVEDPQKKITTIMHLQDKEISRAVFRFNPKYFSDHLEGEFFRMHYGYYNRLNPVVWKKTSVIDGNEPLGYERSKVARRFMHMLDIAEDYALVKGFDQKKQGTNNKTHAHVLENLIERVTKKLPYIMGREDHLLHIEYGLVCADIAETVQNFRFNKEQIVTYIPQSMEKLYYTVDEIVHKKLKPQREQYPKAEKVIMYLESVLEGRK